MQLRESLAAWDTAVFKSTLKRELEQLDAAALPLQAGLRLSSAVSDSPFEVMLIDTGEEDGRIAARIGVFYKGVIGGCSCADDPTPMDEYNEYCEIELRIDKTTADAELNLISD